MSMTTTNHIVIAEDGTAWIDQTQVKVIEIIVDKLAHGSSPEEMHFQYPHLSLAQIHAALAYYYDNRPALDAEIELQWREVNELAAQAADSPFQKRLRELASQR